MAWKQSLLILYAVSALIMVRSVFRAIEYIMGENGYLLGHEWTLYLFDSVPMFLVTILFYLRSPINRVHTKSVDVEGIGLRVQSKA